MTGMDISSTSNQPNVFFVQLFSKNFCVHSFSIFIIRLSLDKTKEQFIREIGKFILCRLPNFEKNFFFLLFQNFVLGKKLEIGTKIANNGNNITARRITTSKKKSGNVFEDEKGRKGIKKKVLFGFSFSLNSSRGLLFYFI